MTKFSCNVCGFSAERDKVVENCPYCGKKNSLEEEENAEDLIKRI